MFHSILQTVKDTPFVSSTLLRYWPFFFETVSSPFLLSPKKVILFSPVFMTSSKWYLIFAFVSGSKYLAYNFKLS